MNAKGGCELVVKNRIKAAWPKWKDIAGVLCDAKMTKYLKGNVYKTMIRPVLMYGAEAWSVTKGRGSAILERTKMRMLRWIPGVSLKDKKRNEVIRKTLGVTCITDKIREARLRWYGHANVMQREDENSMKRIMAAEVNGRRNPRRQKRYHTARHEVSPICD